MKVKLEQLNQEIKKAELKLTALKNETAEYEAMLADKKKLIEQTEEFSKVGRWAYYFDSLEMTWSEETRKMFEYPEDYNGTIVEFYLKCVDSMTAERLSSRGSKMRESKEGMMMNQFITTPSGKTKFLSFSTIPIYNENNEIIGADGLVKDISDEIIGKKGLNNFFNLSKDLHCIIDADKFFVKVSPSWTKLLGYSEEEMLLHSYLEFVHPDDHERSDVTIKDIDEAKQLSTFENRYISKSGEVIYLSWISNIDKESSLAYCTARDITKSKIKQEELLSDLSEKGLLLREIHHRVKNNLQIITSLLSLQSGVHSEHSQLAELYEDSKNRIKSMASIHEMFYQSKQLDKIEFGEYLDKLIGDISKSFSSNQRTIDLDIDVEKIYVDLDTAIPLGLLINEIITNSIKHGADEGGEVKIFVKFEMQGDDKLKLIIGDNGINAPKNLLRQERDSLGLMLISSLVDQINGNIIQLEGFKGAVYQLVFEKQ